MRDKIIQVLWVDDDPLITDAYPREAEMLEGIEIVPFLCWGMLKKRWRMITTDGTPFF